MFAARDRASAAEFRTGELSVYRPRAAEGPAAHVDGEVCERQLKILVRRLDPVPRRRGRRARAGGERGPSEQCEGGDRAARAHTRRCRKSVTSGEARSAGRRSRRPPGQQLPSHRDGGAACRPGASASRTRRSGPGWPSARMGWIQTWSAPASRCAYTRAAIAFSSPQHTMASTSRSLPPSAKSSSR